jgi:cell division septation protein DedD
MRNNDTGEFELVVGNRQLLSGFFIVVLLFAVGVALGYILGQNSEKSLKVTDAASTIPPPVQLRPQPASPVQAAPPPAPPEGEGSPASADASGPATQPARDTQPTAAPPAAPPAPAAEAPAAPAGETAAEPAPGTYWQVMAVGHSDAQIMVRTLKDKGFPALTSPGAKGLTRVLVGPYNDRQSLSRAKTDLEAAGMATPYRVEIGADAGRE